MSFGLGMQRWQDAFEEDDLAAVRDFVLRVDPSQDWEALLGARPTPTGFSLWSDLGHYWDDLLSLYGLVAPYDAVNLLPIDFAHADSGAPRCVNLRPTARRAWFVVDAGWVDRSWPGHTNAAYARKC